MGAHFGPWCLQNQELFPEPWLEFLNQSFVQAPPIDFFIFLLRNTGSVERFTRCA